VFEGVLTALVTPLRGGAVDERALQELVETQIAAGVDGLVPCGSTGEAATLSHDEHRRVIEVVVAATRGRVVVVAGTGSNSTREAIALTQHAKEAGADGALLISPYYNRPTAEGIVEHYAAVAREASLPLVAYNIPARTGSNILPETIARLAEIEQVVGVKEACGDLHQIAQTRAATPEEFALLSGDDWATLPVLAIGGQCAPSGPAISPGLRRPIIACCRSWTCSSASRIPSRSRPPSPCAAWSKTKSGYR